MKNILCVEDSEDERILLRAGLAGYLVTFATSVKTGLLALEKGNFSLLILDLQLPDGNGLDLLAAARGIDRFVKTPIVMLTCHKDLTNKTAAFGLGADAYVEKPCDPREIKLRVDAMIRRFEQLHQDQEVIRLGGLLLDVQGQTLKRLDDSSYIHLTSLEFRILFALGRKPGRIFSRDALIETAWGGGVSVEARTVDSHIANLRRKIRKSGVNIETVVGAGYKVWCEANSRPATSTEQISLAELR
jgi:DNA-binding response OmpR family regulator